MRNFTVLHVEDDPNDAFFVQRAFGKAGLEVDLQTVPDGRQALDYLNGVGKFANRGAYPVPQVILLDLKLPVLNGFEVLSVAKKDPRFKTTPIAVLSSSDHFDDRERARLLGADNYFTKTLSFTDVVEYVRKLLPPPTASQPAPSAAGQKP